MHQNSLKLVSDVSLDLNINHLIFDDSVSFSFIQSKIKMTSAITKCLNLMAIFVYFHLVTTKKVTVKIVCDVDFSIEEGFYIVRCKSSNLEDNQNIACCSLSMPNSKPFIAWGTNCTKTFEMLVPSNSFETKRIIDPKKYNNCQFTLKLLNNTGEN